jgi:hypothetical protein
MSFFAPSRGYGDVRVNPAMELIYRRNHLERSIRMKQRHLSTRSTAGHRRLALGGSRIGWWRRQGGAMTIVKLLLIMSVAIAVMADRTVNQMILTGLLAVLVGLTFIHLFHAA